MAKLTVTTLAQQTKSSLASGTTLTNLGSFSLPAGRWMLNVSVKYPTNATGRRYMNISLSSAGTDYGISYMDDRKAVTGGVTICSMHCWMKVTSATTFYVNGYQNSGSTLSNIYVNVNYIGMPD